MNRSKIFPSTPDLDDDLSPTERSSTQQQKKHELTWLFSFVDPLKNAQYAEFRRSNVSLVTFGIFQTIVTFSSTASKIVAFRDQNNNVSRLTLASLIVGLVFVVLFGWLMFGIQYFSKYHNHKVTNKMRTTWFPMTETIWLIGIIVSLQLSLTCMIF